MLINKAVDQTRDEELLEKLVRAKEQILREIRKVIIGQDDVIEQVLISLFVGGHSIITGVPGLAKTLLIKTIANALDLKFKRIQFTPDLMPSDITGTEVIEEDRATGKRHFHFVPGPIFANIVLADEINRTPPKTQAALLEAMQEGAVTVQGVTYELPKPFFVLATQNPIELEGTYPLPEAQLDRFMFNIKIGYLSEEEEVEVVRATTVPQDVVFERQITGRDIIEFQRLIRQVPAADSVIRYAVRLVGASRPGNGAFDFVRKWVNWGASLRASQFLILGGKARAILNGRYHVSCEDVRALAYPVLRHRILVNFQAESEGVNSEEIIRRLLEAVPEPTSGLSV
ncbi:MAG: AAA family ATPase [Blastocatellia bacterium]|nr:AAA family ATPase [Blastocatellia bacterium]MCS7157144.1 AAA family ATPase [Blastocatellia bacterium]MCX7752393.1 AAA family ATPase [Blastocatellia bacterium]MDW8167276.1 AAA family ATPase [Acidobacteriota bacterium]